MIVIVLGVVYMYWCYGSQSCGPDMAVA